MQDVVDHGDALERLERANEDLDRVCKDVAEDRARRAQEGDEILRRLYDLRVEIRSWSGRPPPPFPLGL